MSRTAVVWLCIVVVCAVAAAMHRFPDERAAAGGDPVGRTLIGLQSKYLVGVAEGTDLIPVDTAALYAQAEEMLNIGTVGQRQRFVILAAELAGPAEARRQLESLSADIADPPKGDVELTDDQRAVQRILHALYPPRLAELDGGEAAEAAVAGAEALPPEDRALLVEQLGWFGDLALAPEGAGAAAREAVLRPARAVAFVMLGAAVAGLTAGGIGFVGLVLAAVFVLLGRLRSGLAPAAGHIVYAETFLVWLVGFLLLQYAASLVPVPPGNDMLPALGAFLLSLAALAWPVLRGLPWARVRRDVGLTAGTNPALEPLIGLAGYLATLPLLAAGLAVTVLLMTLQSILAGQGPTFAPAGGPAHPIILEMAGPGVWPKVQILLIAAVAAPVVEETFFRGVLYRHLRGLTGRWSTAASVTAGTLVNAFLFAVIHPQGWVAVPALMSLAAGMTLVREWRGTLVPSMVIHGVSNGLLMSMLWIVLSA